MFLTPRWLLSHLFAATLVALFMAAGFWQLERLGQRQDENAVITARMTDPVSLEELLLEPVSEREYRRVQVTGSYDPSRELLIANRSDEGSPGFWIWTTFDTVDGDLVINRGFVPRSLILGTQASSDRGDVDAEGGDLVIEGLVRSGIAGGRASEDRSQLSGPDARLAAEILDLDTALGDDLYVELAAQDPARGTDIPMPVPHPDVGEGPHRSYAFQWFTFATIGMVGYALLLNRIRRGDQSKGDVPS